MRTPSDAVRSSPVRLMPGRYAMVRCADIPHGSDWFMVARDSDEVTAIVEERALPGLSTLAADEGYALLEIRVAAPSQSVGLLAAVTRALAEAGLNILVVSTYSKDYVLLKDEAVAAGLQALSRAGFPVDGG